MINSMKGKNITIMHHIKGHRSLIIIAIDAYIK